MTNNQFQEIGFLSRSKGLKGVVKASFEVFFLDALEQGFTFKHVFLFKKGTYLPYFIERINWKARPTEVKFEEIKDRNEAATVENQKMFVRLKDIEPFLSNEEEEEEGWNGLIDYQMLDAANDVVLGKIKDIMELPQHELAEVEMQGGKELLFPLHEEFIVEIDEEKKTIKVDVPDGLLDL